MKIMKTMKVICLLLFSVAAATGQASAQEQKYEVGSRVKVFQANDQHGRAYKLDGNTRYLLLSFDMGTGKVANAALTKKGKDYFGQKKVAYVANIHGMPGIGRFFAFRKMKKYNHRIIYGDDANLMTPFPEKKDHVTVLKLNSKQKVLRISYWEPKKEDLEKHLK